MGVAVLDDVVRGDPDARVRARAALTLGEADRDDGDAAANALVAALQDPESQVVLAALEALESVGDETLISELMPLLDHPSAEVRERTSETIDWLE
jgi:HEAT repeat protein